VRSEGEELRRHLDRELVRLELLCDDGPPHVPPAGLALWRAAQLGDRRPLAPRQVAHLPLGVLRELVEPEDFLVIVLLAVDRHPLRFHRRMIMAVHDTSTCGIAVEFLS
jgi:hypothetical protein